MPLPSEVCDGIGMRGLENWSGLRMVISWTMPIGMLSCHDMMQTGFRGISSSPLRSWGSQTHAGSTAIADMAIQIFQSAFSKCCSWHWVCC